MGIVLAFNLLLLGTCGYAIWRGGPPERLTGVALVVAAAATLFAHLPRTVHFRSLETELLLIDAALLVGLAVIALQANRYWPIWITAIHATAVAVHIAKAANPAIVWPLYATAASISSIPIQILLAVATYRHTRRLRLHGSDPPWRRSSRH